MPGASVSLPRRAIGAVRRLFRWDHRLDPRIAYLSPMPPAPTGIATYSRAVLEGLERIGYREHRLQPIWPVEPKHEAQIPWHILGIYHLGNNVAFHRDIYRHAIQTPGLVVIHDLALDDFVRGLIAAGDPLGHQAAREGVLNAPRLAGFEEAVRNEPLRVPFVAHAARRARGIIVHSPFAERYLQAFGCWTPVYVAPHPVVETEEAVRAAERRRAVLRAGLEPMGMRSLVLVAGDLNAAKLIDRVLASVARMPEDVHLALVGRRIEGYDVEAEVQGSGLGARVSLHTDVTDEDFLAWLCAADVVVDLRHPHRGEVSGTLARAMQCGRATVVSGTGTYLDIPPELVVHVSPGPVGPEELATAIGRLLEDEGLRTRIGEAARAHIAELARSHATARVYAEAIDGTLALLSDPTRRALARWAGALADLGLTEADLERGWGVGYARALAELAPPRGAEGPGTG